MANIDELKSTGLKATLPRLKILDVFQKGSQRHMTAEDVFRVLLEERWSDEIVRAVIANRAAARFEAELSDAALRTIISRGTGSAMGIQPLRDLATLRGLISSKAVLALLDLPAVTGSLPATWPYNVVGAILTVRASAVAANRPGTLGPLGANP